jgi:hypothetical protein
MEISIIIEYMAKKLHQRIPSTPSLRATKEKSKMKSILKKLIHIKKGH